MVTDTKHAQLDDISYRGILSFRGLRLLALVAMTLSQLAAIALLGNDVVSGLGTPFLPEWARVACNILKSGGSITFPLLLVATFTTVLQKQENFFKSLITYFVMAAATYALIVLFLSKLIYGVLLISPEFLKEIEANEEAHTFLTRLIAKIIEGIIPGDGTLHLENLNQILSMGGIKLSLPDTETLIASAESAGVPSELVRLGISFLGSLQPLNLAEGIMKVITKIISIIPDQYMDFYASNIVPAIYTRIVYSMNINVFWNLFLYTLAFFFISYEPKNMRGSSLLLFRCCAILPIGWMVISFLVTGSVKIASLVQDIELPVWLAALMTNQKLSSMMIFLSLLMFEKYIELAHAEYYDPNYVSLDEYRSTNRNSLHFSVHLSVVLVVISLVDYFLGKIPGLSYWGIGQSTTLWMAAPFLLLFSYNRKPRGKVFTAVAVPLYYVFHYVLLVELFDIIYQAAKKFLGM